MCETRKWAYKLETFCNFIYYVSIYSRFYALFSSYSQLKVTFSNTTIIAHLDQMTFRRFQTMRIKCLCEFIVSNCFFILFKVILKFYQLFLCSYMSKNIICVQIVANVCVPFCFVVSNLSYNTNLATLQDNVNRTKYVCASLCIMKSLRARVFATKCSCEYYALFNQIA